MLSTDRRATLILSELLNSELEGTIHDSFLVIRAVGPVT
jgi:hypothetical protein